MEGSWSYICCILFLKKREISICVNNFNKNKTLKKLYIFVVKNLLLINLKL